MGLDMYLYRMPKYGNTTVNDISDIENYFDWKAEKENPKSSARKYTLKEWCGTDFRTLPSKHVRDFYTRHYIDRYYNWDNEHKYPRKRIKEEVGYWRKANQIHNWFVDHVQDGEDDCCYHNEVTRDTLELLLNTCYEVLNSCEMVDGEINNGYEYRDGERIPIMVSGSTVRNSSIARELLPTQGGFFFGSTDYDEYYVEDIRNTIKIIENVLETTDFETQMIYYVSSW